MDELSIAYKNLLMVSHIYYVTPYGTVSLNSEILIFFLVLSKAASPI